MAPGSHPASPLGFVNKVSLKHNHAVWRKDSNFAQDGGRRWWIETRERAIVGVRILDIGGKGNRIC